MSRINFSPDSQSLQGLQGQVAVITGAASGIGLASAKLLASNGVKVVAVDVQENRLKEAVSAIGHGAESFRCDVSSWAENVALFEFTKKTFGSPTIVFLNAGIDTELKVSAGGEEAQRAIGEVRTNFLADEYEAGDATKLKEPPLVVLDVNVKGPVYGVKLAIHHLAAAGGGRIIVTASADAYMAIPYNSIYDTSKHAVLGLIRSVSQRPEVLSKGITTTVLCPSLTSTPMTAEINPAALEGLIASTPEDVGQAVLYTATAPAADIHGRTVLVKGKALYEVEQSYKAWMEPIFCG
ncbi:hypothetical protein LTS08_003737 [Lithohypha guttulata]|uniref:uncharacterized protein n=1 Tax=Lithohypha guttulata TaxID=1690604 RepID=UPI002DE1E4D7|nr:hypothetical protein LTR51_001306 [Lithohypha guttulata]KAK5102935.1 hypothetical protein LTS08_003737 [Lithohypha guttulata]